MVEEFAENLPAPVLPEEEEVAELGPGAIGFGALVGGADGPGGAGGVGKAQPDGVVGEGEVGVVFEGFEELGEEGVA